MKYTIYALEEFGKIRYVGITKNPRVRMQQHRRNKPTHNFTILTQTENIETATKTEQFLIEKHNTVIFGWNKTSGGDYMSNSGYDRKGIGGTKKGSKPWNKGIKGCFSEDTIIKMREKRAGRVFSSKLNRDIVEGIRTKFANHPTMTNVGEVQPNGKVLTQERAFANTYHHEYNISSICLYNILIGKTWKID